MGRYSPEPLRDLADTAARNSDLIPAQVGSQARIDAAAGQRPEHICARPLDLL